MRFQERKGKRKMTQVSKEEQEVQKESISSLQPLFTCEKDGIYFITLKKGEKLFIQEISS